jgi:hypothetical protein
MIAIQDPDLQTDHRWGVTPGACDKLAAAAGRRKDGQGQ